MKHLDLDFNPIEEVDLFRVPRSHKRIVSDGAQMVKGDAIGYVEGVPVLVRMDATVPELAALDDIYDMATEHKFQAGGIRRANTGTYYGESFGTVEPLALRRRYSVSRSNFSIENYEFSAALERMVKVGWRKVKRNAREYYDQIDTADKALSAWRIGKTPYTSGVINATVTLPYHRDRGNVDRTGSLMWISRKLVKGGHLHIPELSIVVDCSHGAMLAFYGEIFWHGVTAINDTTRARAARYSIVAYAKRKILKAGTPEEEYRKGIELAAKHSEEERETVLKYD